MFAFASLVCAVSVLTAIFVTLRFLRPRNFPPGPRWLPLLGNSLDVKRLVRKLGSQHAAFEALCDKFGTSTLGLRLGGDLLVVTTSYEAAVEALTSDAFLGRPDNFFIRLRCMGTRKGITFVEGPLWTEHRSFAVRHFRQLGYGKQHMEDLILDEVKDLLRELEPAAEQGSAVCIGPLLPPSVLNVLWALTAGTRFPHGDPQLQRVLDLLAQRAKAFDMAGGILSTVPWLRHFAPERCGYNLVTKFNASLKELLEETIAAHHASYTPGITRDLIDAYLHETKAHQSEGIESTFTDDQLVMVVLDMFLAGAHTTSSSLNFALMAMVLYPDIQAKCFEEIQNNVKTGCLPTLLDRGRLPYVEAFLMEVMRTYYIAPIIGPRRALWDTKLDGFDIPKGTVLLINTHTIHYDEKHWNDPCVFRPERFLDEMGNVKQDERLLSFSLGKRRCFGDVLARNCLFLFLTGLLQTYCLSVPPGETPPSAETVPGLTHTPKPYRVLLTHRTT